MEKEMIGKYIAESEARSREYGLVCSAMQYAINWQKEQDKEHIKYLENKATSALRTIHKMYTEEEVKELCKLARLFGSLHGCSLNFDEWFEQNKKNNLC